jgi:mannosyltransferase
MPVRDRRARGRAVGAAAERRAAWPVAVAALTAIGGAVRFVGLDRQGLWLDETVTASLLERPFGEMLGELPSSESTPPLYYVAAWGWSRLFEVDAAGIRSLSALVGTLTIPVAYAAAATLVSRRAGLATAALASVSPVLVWYSQEARSYALLTFFCALSFLFFARALRHPSGWSLAAWAAASALALLTHYFAGFLVGVEAVVLLTLVPARRATAVAVGFVAAAGLALVPLLVDQASGSATWIRDVDLSLRVGESLRQLAIPSLPPIWAGTAVPEGAYGRLWTVALAVLVLAVVTGVALGRGREPRGLLLALLVGGVALSGPVALAIAGREVAGGRGDFVLYRNVLPVWLPLAVVIAGGFAVRRAGALGLTAVGLLVAASCGVLALSWTDERSERDDWPTVSRALGPRAVIVLSPSWQVDALTYHVPGVETIPEDGVEVDEIDVLVRRRAPSYTTLASGYEPPPGFDDVSYVRAQHWDVTRYRSSSPVRVTFAELNRVRPEDGSRIVLVRAGGY